jgi:hypothetical protein
MRIIPVIAILLLLCGVGVCAESKPPSPSAADSGAQPKDQPGNTQSKSDSNKPTPKNYPSIIEISKAPIIQVETTDKTEKRHDYSSSEWWLVYLTFALAFVTLGLAIYTAKLYRATVGLGSEAKSTSDRQAAEMEKSLAIAKEAADAAQKSADVAEKTLTLGERPYVFAFNVSKFCISEDLIPAITYEVANFGKTPAIIERVQAALENIESNLDTPIEVDSLVSAPIFSGGEVRKGIKNETPSNMINFKTIDNAIVPDLKRGEELFFRVIIRYRGPFTEGHESSFCWIYNTHTNHFEPYGHEDYNYTK